MMLPLPDHRIVRLVAEDGHVTAPDQPRQLFEIVQRRDASGRIVRRVQDDGLRARVVREEAFDIAQVRAEIL